MLAITCSPAPVHSQLCYECARVSDLGLDPIFIRIDAAPLPPLEVARGTPYCRYHRKKGQTALVTTLRAPTLKRRSVKSAAVPCGIWIYQQRSTQKRISKTPLGPSPSPFLALADWEHLAASTVVLLGLGGVLLFPSRPSSPVAFVPHSALSLPSAPPATRSIETLKEIDLHRPFEDCQSVFRAS